MSIRTFSLLGGIVALTLGGRAAMAHGGDHDAYHDEVDAEHQAQHKELNAEHEGFHRNSDAQYQRMLAWCDGDPDCEWVVQRRLARRHRLEHRRERIVHQLEHDQANDEHDAYHRVTGEPEYRYYTGPDYRSYTGPRYRYRDVQPRWYVRDPYRDGR